LRLPSTDELEALFCVAEGGIHPSEEMPFGVAWTDDLRLDAFVDFHRTALKEWQPDHWDFNLVTFRGRVPVGSQSLHGQTFSATRTVSSGSWLGRPHQGRGFGTEQRAAVLELAFGRLGALAAETGALAHNHASLRVSEKLGYRFTFEDTLSPRGTPLPHLNFRLERDGWRSPVPVEVEGLERCLPLFGVIEVP